MYTNRILMVGHALLIGVGGSGKQSLAKLAAFMCQFTTAQISVSSEFNTQSLLEQLKVSALS
jgi:dynein heavy chain